MNYTNEYTEAHAQRDMDANERANTEYLAESSSALDITRSWGTRQKLAYRTHMEASGISHMGATSAIPPELTPMLEAIRTELAVAIPQMLPTDDQIICDHVRKAHAMIVQVLDLRKVA